MLLGFDLGRHRSWHLDFLVFISCLLRLNPFTIYTILAYALYKPSVFISVDMATR